MREMSRYQDMPVGPYRLTKLIGVGPVSRVFLAARHDRAERLVALKLFEAVSFDLLAEKDQALDELRLLACLEHPSILPTLDDGLHEHMLYLVAPHIGAGSLRQRLTAVTAAGELLPIKETMALLRQVGEALQYAHTQRIVHANLKPENVLLPGEGKALLTDFLLPSLVKSERAARILSTFAAFYMAPEQFQGSATPLSDQYALACLAYELLTGHLPFDGDDVMSLARKHATSEPKAPSQLQPKRAQHIDHVLLKALAKRPEERYPDIQTFFAELSAPPPLVSLTSSAEAMPPTTPTPQTQHIASTLIGVAVTEILPPQQAFPSEIEVLPPQQAFPSSLVGVKQSLEQPLVSQQAFLEPPAISEQETIRQSSRLALPASLAIFEQETVQQVPVEAVPVEAVPVAVVPGMYEASTVMFPAPDSPLVDPRQPLPDSAQQRAQQATWQAYAQRAQGTSNPSRRQVWLAAGLVALAMIVSISGIAIFFGMSAANHTQSQAQTGGVTATIAPTSPAAQVSPAVTAATTPTQPAVTPTVSHPTPTPAASTGLSCHVDFSLSSQWPGGFVAKVTITNTGAGDVNGWKLAFTFPGGQQITNGWNGKFTQNGSQVSIANADFNRLLAVGSSVSPGFQATSPNGNLKPRSFSLNGVPCR